MISIRVLEKSYHVKTMSIVNHIFENETTLNKYHTADFIYVVYIVDLSIEFVF